MPNMANITVKKNDGTTDVIYTALVPSAGDRTPAVWKNQTVGTAMGHRPEFRVTSRDSGTGTARRLDVEYTYPMLVVGTDGKTTIAEKAVFNGSLLVPKGMADTDVNEAVSQYVNLCASVLFKDSAKSGYAPT